jgi:lipopolysaccharide export system permease protein
VQDNFIVASSGVMSVSDDKRYLNFNLKNGWRYEERGANSYSDAKTDFVRLGFKEYKKQFDLSSFMFQETPDSVNRNSEKVYSMRQLNKAIDSLAKENARIKVIMDASVSYANLKFTKYLDSVSSKKLDSASGKKMKGDSLFKAAKSLDELIPDSARYAVHSESIAQVSSLSSSISNRETTLKDKGKVFRRHKIEWHRKILLSSACLILFLIGAPLGSIIRKGGLGTPLIAAISFFMLFYFSTTIGEKFAKEDKLSPFAGMWLAAFILVPIGIFLTYKAMRDSQLFNKESYYRMAKSLRVFMGKVSFKRHA